MKTTTQTVEVLELFTFVDGIRYAWVTYQIGRFIERRCVGVREVYEGRSLP